MISVLSLLTYFINCRRNGAEKVLARHCFLKMNWRWNPRLFPLHLLLSCRDGVGLTGFGGLFVDANWAAAEVAERIGLCRSFGFYWCIECGPLLQCVLIPHWKIALWTDWKEIINISGTALWFRNIVAALKIKNRDFILAPGRCTLGFKVASIVL